MTDPDEKPTNAAPEPATEPRTETPALVAAADLMGEVAEVAQAAALAALKLEMEGLSVLFGGEGEKTEAELRAEEAETEAGFDNMPV